MTSFAARYNRGRKFDFDPKDLPYKNLKDLYAADGDDKVYTLHALYINTKGKYDPNPVAGIDGALIDLPAHMTDTVREILADDDAIEFINDNGVGFSVREYLNDKYNTICYTIDFVDLK